MKKIRIRFLIQVILICLMVIFTKNVKAATIIEGVTFFEDIGRYSVAVAGNNNSYRGASFGSAAELIESYPDNWETIKSNIPEEILNRINNMSGSYLDFTGEIKGSWISTMLHGTDSDHTQDVLVIKPDGSYFVIEDRSKQTVEIDINQSGWYYVSILDAPVTPQNSWAITVIYENSSLPIKYMKMLYCNLGFSLQGGSDHDSIEIYYNSKFKLKDEYDIFGVIIGAGVGSFASPGETEDTFEAILSDGTYQQLYEDQYNGKTIFAGRTTTDFASGIYNAVRSHDIPGGEVDIFAETLGKDYFNNKDVIGYRITKIGVNSHTPQLIGLAQEIYSPELYINTTITDETPNTIFEGENMHVVVNASNLATDNEIAYSATITSKLDGCLSNPTNISVKINGNAYSGNAAYDSVNNLITLSDISELNPADEIIIEYDAVVNENIKNKGNVNTNITISTNAAIKAYPIDMSLLTDEEKAKYEHLYLQVQDDDNTSGTYKKVSAGAEITHIDQVTKDVLQNYNIAGNVGDSYTTASQNIAGYELVIIPSNANGNLTEDKITITYEYRKLSNVITKYIDENSNTEIVSQVSQTLKEGDLYTTEKKSFDGYTFTKDSGNTSGTIVRDNIEVLYYYKKNSAGVVTKYIDQVTGDKIAEAVTKNGLENDSYTTDAKDVDGYILVVTPDNASGKMTVDQIIVTYEYRKLSNVVTKYIDENSNAEIVTQVSQTLKEGEAYTTEKKSFDGYTFTKDSGNTAGTLGNTNVEVVYYYKKNSAGVVAKYIDQVTKVEIVEAVTKNGLENDSYTTDAKDIDGYELVVSPDNASGNMMVDQIIVTYEYRKLSNVVTKYIDENSNAEIDAQVSETLKEGDTYTTEQKSFDGYTFTKDSGNTTGTLGNTNIEVVYYYKKNGAGVVAKYIDQLTGTEIAEVVTKNGLENDNYTTEAKDIEGYTLVVTPDNASGKMTVDQIIVTYEYRKLSNVVTKYIDENSNTEIVAQVSQTLKEGDAYITEKKSFDGYTFTKDSGNTTGTLGNKNIEVVYYYKKNSAGVEVKYIDQVTGNEIADKELKNGLENEEYTTEAKAISGYELVVTPTNANGKFTTTLINVTYEYRKLSNIVTKYIDQNSNTEIITQVSQTLKEGDTYTTEKKSFDGYTFTKDSGNTTGTLGNTNIEVVYYYKKNSAGVVAKYIDQVTGDEIAEAVTKNGLENDSYTTEAKDVDGYILVVTPDNASGKMTVDQIIVTYEYRKLSNVVTKYIDENSNAEIVAQVSETLKEGDTYTTEKKSFDGYTFTKDSGNTAGTLGNANIEVVYYYKKNSAGVVAKYIDQVTKVEIAEAVTKNGLENDSYTTDAKDIDGYELVVSPDNASGNMMVDQIIVTYEYRKLSNIVTKYIDENSNNEIVEQVSQTLKEGDIYTTEKKSFDGYTFTKDSGNTAGTLGNTNIEVVYYYKKISAGVDTRFIDQVTGEEIADMEHQEGLEKDVYTTTAKDVAGYELVLIPDNKEGEMTVELITVTYEYRLVSKVTTKYIDVNSRTEIVTAVENNYKEGDTYTTEEKILEGYQLVGKTDNTSGTMGRSNIEVTYEYKKISNGIEVVYVDQVTGSPIAASVVKTGLENQEYTTEAKTIDGYELVTIPSNATGKMTVGKITIKYEYRKLSDVIAKYIDVNYNTEITQEVKQTLKEGDLYTTEQKSFEGYMLVNNPQNKAGVMARENIEVVYEYKKISAGVDVKYIDQVTGEEIADKEHQDGLEKDNYTTEAKKIEGYELVKTPTNKNGEMTVELITVTYEYRLLSDVTTKHIDANTGKEIVDPVVETYKEGDAYTTTAKDLVGYILTKSPEVPNGTMGREDIEVVYEYKMISDGLIVKYIDEITGDLLDMENYTGNENDMIQLEEKSFDKYILTKRPSVSEIKLTVEPQEVRFYYKKLIDINVIGIDAITGEEIYRKVQNGVEGEEYTTTPVILPGYEITKTPDNASGTYTREDVDVIYEYKRVSGGVIVTYVDKDTREILDSQTITGYVGEEYETDKKAYEKYDFVEVVGNPKGKLEVEQIEITYLYAKKSGMVEIVYVDTEGNELLKEEISGKVDETFEIIEKEITNYRVKEVDGELKGAYTIDKQIVKITMEKIKGKITINFVDKDGNILFESVVTEGEIDEEYYYEALEKEGYEIAENAKIEVKYIDGEIIIDVVYEKIELPEPPATGDINVVLYIIIALGSVLVISKRILKKAKN